MKNGAVVFLALGLFFFCDAREEASNELSFRFEEACNTPSDISEHVPLLYQLSKEVSSVVEIGMRGMVSSWGILQGLSESPFSHRSYIGIDISSPPYDTLNAAQLLARAHGIEFTFLQANDMDIDIPETDFLFIDSLHTYCHLTYELEKFSPSIRKYIAMHDTSPPWESVDDSEYHGDFSEYPDYIDKNKRGLWLAVEDFLQRHPEWKLAARYINCHGFTILERKNDEQSMVLVDFCHVLRATTGRERKDSYIPF